MKKWFICGLIGFVLGIITMLIMQHADFKKEEPIGTDDFNKYVHDLQKSDEKTNKLLNDLDNLERK